MLNIPYLDSGFLGYSPWYEDLEYYYFRGIDIGFIRIILSGEFGSLVFTIIHFSVLGVLFKINKVPAFFKNTYLFSIAFFSILMFTGAITFAFNFLMLLIFWIGMQHKSQESII